MHIRQAGLSTPAAHASVPYRLEAAGWTAAVLSDAVAAAMGRLPATQPSGLPLSPINSWVRGKPCVSPGWAAMHECYLMLQGYKLVPSTAWVAVEVARVRLQYGG